MWNETDKSVNIYILWIIRTNYAEVWYSNEIPYIFNDFSKFRVRGRVKKLYRYSQKNDDDDTVQESNDKRDHPNVLIISVKFSLYWNNLN